jgi:hypothetical protein
VPIFKRKIWKRLSFLPILLILPLLGVAPAISGHKPPATPPALDGQPAANILDSLNLLVLYTVQNGQGHTRVYRRSDISPGKPLEVKGYVSGVLVLLKDSARVCLDGDPMSKIRENRDGTLSCRNYGFLRPESSITPYIGTADPQKPSAAAAARLEAPKDLHGGYSAFPGVLGSSLSPGESFTISLAGRAGTALITCRQEAYRTFMQLPIREGRQIPVRYQDDSVISQFNQADLKQRLTTFAEGIKAVEKKFGMELTSVINLVDYDRICNAMTCDGSGEIWVYARLLKQESLAELKTIGEHESLHLVTNRMGFAHVLREQFADLLGLEDLSMERFMLVTKGITRHSAKKIPNKKRNFFAFINERHFIKGMSGGHSQQNPDEFCASFLHSLMYVDSLKTNLNRPLSLFDRDKPHLLTRTEKRDVEHEYLKTLDILRDSLPRIRQSGHDTGKVSEVLEQAQHQAREQCSPDAGYAGAPRTGRRGS